MNCKQGTITVTLPQPGEQFDYITAQRISEVFGVKVRALTWDKDYYVIWNKETSCWLSGTGVNYFVHEIKVNEFILYEEPKLCGREAKQALLDGKHIKNLRTGEIYYKIKWQTVGRFHVYSGEGITGHEKLLTMFDTDDQWEIATPKCNKPS